MIYQFLLFHKQKCIYEDDFAEVRTSADPIADKKLLVGMLQAMTSMAQQICPDPVCILYSMLINGLIIN